MQADMAEEAVKGSETAVEAVLDWQIPESLDTKYANQLTVQVTPYECTLAFFEVRPPLLFGGPEENKRKLEENPVAAKCVARIVVSRERIREFSKALETAARRVEGTQ